MENLSIGDRVVMLNRTAKLKQDGKERDFSLVPTIVAVYQDSGAKKHLLTVAANK